MGNNKEIQSLSGCGKKSNGDMCTVLLPVDSNAIPLSLDVRLRGSWSFIRCRKMIKRREIGRGCVGLKSTLGTRGMRVENYVKIDSRLK